MPINLELTTKRLALKPISQNDVGLVVEMFTDEQIMKYVGGRVSKEKIVEEMRFHIRRGGNGCIGKWCISDRITGESLGTIALLPLPTDKDDTDWVQLIEDQFPKEDIEIGYFLRRVAWGRGYATEAVQRVLRFVFEHSPLEKIVALRHPRNNNSRRVLEKTGFESTGVRRSYGEDLPEFQIVRENWLSRQ